MADDWYRFEGRPNEVKVIPVLDDEPIAAENKTCCSWINEFNTLDLQSHSPFDEGDIIFNRNAPCFKKNIVTTLHEALLRSDVGLNAGCCLCWVNELNIVGVYGLPLLSCGCCYPVRLREQFADFLCIQRRRQHGSKLALTGGPPWGGATQPSLRVVVSVGGCCSRSDSV